MGHWATYSLCSGEILRKKTLVWAVSMLCPTHRAQVLNALLKASYSPISAALPRRSYQSQLHHLRIRKCSSTGILVEHVNVV